MAFAPALRRSFLQAAVQLRPTVAWQQPCFQMAPQAVLRSFSSNLKYAPSHEWLRMEADGTATMGISDFAQQQLGEIVYADLPDEGSTFEAKDAILTLESVKAVGQVYAPANCEVIVANEALNEQPDLINSSAEGDGWLLKIKLNEEATGLMDGEAYKQHCATEVGGH